MRRMHKPIALMTPLPLALACGSSAAAENRRAKNELADDPCAIAAGFLKPRRASSARAAR